MAEKIIDRGRMGGVTTYGLDNVVIVNSFVTFTDTTHKYVVDAYRLTPAQARVLATELAQAADDAETPVEDDDD